MKAAPARPPGLYDIGDRFDADATNWAARGVRVYDCGREPTEAERRLIETWRASPPPQAPPDLVKHPNHRAGVFIWTGPTPGDFGRCVCGGCTFSLDCAPKG